jgi:low affinity Fe/Cu permease
MLPNRSISKSLISLSLRHELLLALFAAMETCWTFGLFAFLAALIDGRAISPLALWLGFWIALIAGRVLPRSQKRWLVLQLIAIALAVITILAVARVELYERLAVTDLSWLPQFMRAIATTQVSLSAERLLGLAMLFVFVRGLGYAQRPLTLWFVGFRFRVGIVIFFFLIAISHALHPLDLSRWLFAYLSVSLLAIALARIAEMVGDARLGARWAITIVAAIALVIFFGVALLQVLTLDAVTAIFAFLSPLWRLLAIVMALFAFPAALIAEWLVGFLRPLFDGLKNLADALRQLAPQNQQERELTQLDPNAVATVVPILQTLAVFAILLGIGYLIARALHRRMTQIEAENLMRESLGADDDPIQRAGIRKKKKPRARARDLSAESIRRIYAALIARAKSSGVARASAETPYEFLPRLTRVFAHDDDLRAITEAYVATHYAERDLSKELSRVRAAWAQVEKVIRETKSKS